MVAVPAAHIPAVRAPTDGRGHLRRGCPALSPQPRLASTAAVPLGRPERWCPTCARPLATLAALACQTDDRFAADGPSLVVWRLHPANRHASWQLGSAGIAPLPTQLLTDRHQRHRLHAGIAAAATVRWLERAASHNPPWDVAATALPPQLARSPAVRQRMVTHAVTLTADAGWHGPVSRVPLDTAVDVAQLDALRTPAPSRLSARPPRPRSRA